MMADVGFAAVDLTNISGILIDLDDTLYEYGPCHSAALDSTFAVQAFGMDRESYGRAYRAARTAVTNRLSPQGACRSRFFAFQDMAHAAGLNTPYEVGYEMDTLYWANFIAAMRPAPQSVDFLKHCLTAGLKICVVTDMTAHVQVQKIRRLGIGDLITAMVTSEEVGTEKPDQRMFSTGAERLNVPLAQCIMLGDSMSKDIEGARAAGISAYHIDLKAGQQ